MKMLFSSGVILLFLSLVSILVAWAFLLEPASLRVSEYRLDVPGWPESIPDLKVAVIADLHVGAPHINIKKVRKVVKLANEQSPDLVLLTGDYLTQGVLGMRHVEPKAIADALSQLRAPLGIWGVLGNHDRWYDGRAVKEALETAGIPILEDMAVPILHQGSELWLVGISDYQEGPHNQDLAFSNVPPGAPFIAMTHTPDLFVEYSRKSGLLIASHTHGGQVLLPIFGRPGVPSEYGERFAIGNIREEGKQMFVSPGIGTSMIPVRFRVPPEISVLYLSP